MADIVQQEGQRYKCATTGGFFDFSPDGAIKNCHEEIDRFCTSKGAPPLIEKISGFPSGYARYARAEINFQCTTQADIDEAKKQLASNELENSKRMCQQDFGFIPSTPEFSNCLLELRKQIFANKRTEQEVAAKVEAGEAQLAQQRQSAADQAVMNAVQSINKAITPTAPTTTRTNCTTFGSNISCTSR